MSLYCDHFWNVRARVTLDWVASLPHLCLTNPPTGAHTLVGTAGWFSALVRHNQAHQMLRTCSGSISDQILKVFGSRDCAQNFGQSNLSQKTVPKANLFGAIRLKLWPILIGFRDPNPRSLGKP